MKPKDRPPAEAAKLSAGLGALMLTESIREVHAGQFGSAWRDRTSAEMHFRAALAALEALAPSKRGRGR